MGQRGLYAEVTILSNLFYFIYYPRSCGPAHNIAQKIQSSFGEEKPSDVESSISASITYIFYVNNREVEQNGRK